MADANQIRINELARELEVKAKVLIDYLPEIGVTEKKTHSSSIDVEHAELARKHFQGLADAEAAAEAAKSAPKPKIARPAAAPVAPAKPVEAIPAAPIRPVAASPAASVPSGVRSVTVPGVASAAPAHPPVTPTQVRPAAAAPPAERPAT